MVQSRASTYAIFRKRLVAWPPKINLRLDISCQLNSFNSFSRTFLLMPEPFWKWWWVEAHWPIDHLKLWFSEGGISKATTLATILSNAERMVMIYLLRPTTINHWLQPSISFLESTFGHQSMQMGPVFTFQTKGIWRSIKWLKWWRILLVCVFWEMMAAAMAMAKSTCTPKAPLKHGEAPPAHKNNWSQRHKNELCN